MSRKKDLKRLLTLIIAGAASITAFSLPSCKKASESNGISSDNSSGGDTERVSELETDDLSEELSENFYESLSESESLSGGYIELPPDLF